MRKLVLSVLVCGLVAPRVNAVDVTDDMLLNEPENAAEEILKFVGDPLKKEIYGELLKKEIVKLFEPEQLNGYYQRLKEGPMPFLVPLNLNFTTIQAQTNNVFAVDYDWQATVQQSTIAGPEPDLMLLKGTFKARGTVAAESALNPRNVLESSFNVHLQKSSGGVLRSRTVAEQAEYVRTTINPLVVKLSTLSTEKLLSAPETQLFLDAISSQMSTQVYWDLSAHGGLESDQKFERQQWVYGLQFGLALRAWDRQSELVKWNLLDWPLAAVRRLTGMSTSFEPVGSAFPSVLIGIDQVDPDDVEREVRGADGAYGRWKVEVLYKSPLANLDGENVFLEAGWRYYKEIGAVEGIAAGGLDEYSYFIATIRMPSAVYMSYSNGKLPLNLVEDQVYELGLHFGFQ